MCATPCCVTLSEVIFVGGLSTGRFRKEVLTFFKDLCDPDSPVYVCGVQACLYSRGLVHSKTEITADNFSNPQLNLLLDTNGATQYECFSFFFSNK